MDVVDEGLRRKDTEAILIDIDSLFPEDSYLNSGGAGSIMAKIGATLKQLGKDDPKRSVIVRMLVGGSGMNVNWDDLRGRYESVFWNSLEGKSHIDHPDATLYVGVYAQTLLRAKMTKTL
ncbi:hypothetical protein LTR96_011037 [Exophiala xenobiotica]|nr:hypothetical protein LTR41_011132 [Exophiala xenobiotica]KAK5220790.1 hypothetical protein LTR47_011139 [Exophiala xenobiotica]KAK5245242.1 hypothetical protein LTS06_009294 [Exophiala xenobiotica]KAK5263556.1 hypothetical protein LTR96_011037 [Exophiala xenobiotica]KAK5332195.1 hypothetical protein LTR98_011668 [Exophiala xenobiotica]